MIGIDSSPAMLAQARAAAAAAGVVLDPSPRRHVGISTSPSRRLSSTARTVRCSTSRRGPTGGGCSSASLLRCAPAAGSPGTPSRSTTTSPHAWTGSTRKRRSPAPITVRDRREPHRPPPGRRGRELAVVGDEERVARAARRRRPRPRSALRRLRPQPAHRPEPRVRLRRGPPPALVATLTRVSGLGCGRCRGRERR